MKTYTYRMIIEPDEKGYHGFVPLLRGVHTIGKTIEETKKSLEEAIRCHIEGLLKDKERIPQEENAVEIVHTLTISA
ncbi:MAG: hypothetical protein A2700_00500 [Candidatus Blackburnbacteria bacterium RIFCSPHIGHO2_01_FULL_44_64]|uniref:HicB-like antitoxin of toxin-antitoxin system domain-containing protein n=1 Tax=Candidatus Blackburnbacteria bacterium RIFCSPHIGHO2_02_FULL_44_20 TaxID=1797516 RepID=A0A1G1V5Z9_9BACT|nr:MAG: hypothetical protein A2700_00500 [Candidatus Blackburnbacteria bacterium RIFCSPHIGHO2_01_FULL_44_64]OGY10731.1 MAG: hypothetical protein A3D26_02710 [Candidatus Blackburnbacteria bacterium RIFCSPHIGHO2_02_FULL_44_20]OGY11915.1 MAG: hypothetical protein A3E16_03965 [Candidatus Blackburnbacteria bacterium RIFCSPHIGHO2_12_FULL_44_25]OGY13638.1 MAG: hypothetical protein A3A62_00165 [Candidatus Blackburnbacteria bacterium RIFCSPLOWO2_01_FULL_44_43]OGY17085.1 MAG: hypothetical protein A3H88_0